MGLGHVNRKEFDMKTLTLAAVTLLTGMTVAFAQSPTHESTRPHGTVGVHGGVAFSAEHGEVIRQHASGQHHQSHQEPGFHAQVGATLPPSAPRHPLPHGLATLVPSAGRNHHYSVVNDRHVMSIRPADASFSFIRSTNEGIFGASLRSLTRASEFGSPARELVEVPRLI